MKSKIFLILILILSFVLRFWALDRVPNSLYTDEIDQGYNALSVLSTLHDEHGQFLPLSFRSFGDWKPPMPTYLMIPFMAVLGANEWSVRLPSVVLGVLSCLLTYFFCRQIFETTSYKNRLALFCSFILAVSPWHIVESRSAMLVVIALFFYQLGLHGFLKWIRHRRGLILSVIGFSLSIYSYYGMRVIVPLTVLGLVVYFREKLFKHSRSFIIPCSIGVLFMIPLLIGAIKTPDVVFGRARTISIFYDQGTKLKKWEMETQDGFKTGTLVTQLFHNTIVLYSRDISRRFFSHFDPEYLFLKGDGVYPFATPGVGILNLSELILIPLGIYFLLTRKVSRVALVFFILFVSIIPASLTYITPASNRTFNAVLPFSILAACGYIILSKRNTILKILITTFCVAGLILFLQKFFIEIPYAHADIWNYGWKEAALYTRSIENKYDSIVVFDQGGMPYIYYYFYGVESPAETQKLTVRPYKEDVYGFEHVAEYKKYTFLRDYEWKDIKDSILPKTLYVVPADKTAEDTGFIHEIKYPDGKSAIRFYEKKF
jgi:4-amino-4-deoxy-L-arabinose transferase-like glycosyltransferase